MLEKLEEKKITRWVRLSNIQDEIDMKIDDSLKEKIIVIHQEEN